MRRAVLALGGTAIGLTLLFAFKAHSLAAATPAPSPAPSTPATAAPAPAKPAAQAATRTITGPVTMTRYGLMQIKITIVGQRITRVSVVQRSGHGAQSRRIASFAVPKLTS
ncbi:MAG TPA: hypothetical protein VKU39_21540 [Streptosporangiaceae bacterium]|nr:hypothetical protein [Streptosporangiaceae bacterium]